jgi:hypothetical protein
MPCKHYKDALIEAAASGDELQGDLRAHLAGCAECRAAFEQEQALFASIDTGLHITANADVPASLLPRVRARLNEAIAPRSHWFQPWIFAAASVALALAIFLFARPHRSGPNSQAKQTPQIPASETPVKNARPQISGPATQIVSSDANKPQTPLHSTFLQPVASSQPEVLVPPDEREAFARFVAVLRARREVAVALATPAPQSKGEPASLEPLQIKELEIKTLEERQTEASEGAGQKQ